MYAARLGGALAVVASVALAVIVLVRDVGLNAGNGWTILLGLAAGAVVLAQPARTVVLSAAVVLVLGMLPALFGGMGLVYGPSLTLLVFARFSRKGVRDAR